LEVELIYQYMLNAQVNHSTFHLWLIFQVILWKICNFVCSILLPQGNLWTVKLFDLWHHLYWKIVTFWAAFCLHVLMNSRRDFSWTLFCTTLNIEAADSCITTVTFQSRYCIP
jgi:hypothetical protein